ncbi:hypothetical protein SANTM175S_04667 [Streptomyces antimycoticus]
MPSRYGMAWVKWARAETPRTSVPRMQLIVISVRRALGPLRSRKTETLLEIASRPVSEEPPLANERSTMKSEAP